MRLLRDFPFTNPMLCRRCDSIHFSPWSGGSELLFAGFVFAVLHKTRASFLQSLSAGCHLCIMIRGQLGSSEVDDRTCELLGADVVLRRRSANTSRLTSVTVISKLGSGLLDIIDPLPGLPPVPNFISS